MAKVRLKAMTKEHVKSQEISGIEQQLLNNLVPYMAVVPPFNYAASTRCMKNGLLPGRLLDALDVLQFLSCTVLSAQKAQRAYGVRASALLAMALDESAFDANNLLNDGKLLDDFYGETSISPQIDEWFLARAKMLATSKRFRAAMILSSNVNAYIRRIGYLGFCDDMKVEDLCHNVNTYELQSCDLAGMLPLGEYDTYSFDKVYDAKGLLVSLMPLPRIKHIAAV